MTTPQPPEGQPYQPPTPYQPPAPYEQPGQGSGGLPPYQPSESAHQAAPPVPSYAGQVQPPQTNPGQGLGIAGLICGILLGPLAFIGLILSIVGFNKSKKAGQKNGIALAGIIVSAILFVISVIAMIFLVGGIVELARFCSDHGPGVWDWNGVAVTCN
jgi:hypothetical protein